jgi:parvulin-like peptidyl-prolyl isomerase
MLMRGKAREREVVVSVNGELICKDAFVRRLEQAAGVQVIRQMVGETLQVQYAKQMKSAPSVKDIDRRFAEVSKQPGFAQQLAKSQRTPEDVKQEIRVALSRIDTLTHGVTVSDAEVRRFYDINVDARNPQSRYFQPETAQVAVIVVRSESLAKQALADLHHGVQWATVAKTRSQDSSKDSGGLMPPIQLGRTHARQFPGFEDAVFSMKIGDTLGPRRFGKAWMLIRMLDRKPSMTRAFRDVKEEARIGALLTKSLPGNSAKVQSEFEQFQKRAAINAFWGQYRDAVSAQ